MSCGGLEMTWSLWVGSYGEGAALKVLEVGMVSDRVMTLLIVFEEDALRLICGYSLLSGRSFEKSSLFMTS